MAATLEGECFDRDAQPAIAAAPEPVRDTGEPFMPRRYDHGSADMPGLDELGDQTAPAYGESAPAETKPIAATALVSLALMLPGRVDGRTAVDHVGDQQAAYYRES